MALAELDQLKLLIGDNAEGTEWSDEFLLEVLDTHEDDVRKSAAFIWASKAAAFARLVRTSESGSTREMQQMYEHAKEQARLYSLNPDGSAIAARPRSVKVVRATREG